MGLMVLPPRTEFALLGDFYRLAVPLRAALALSAAQNRPPQPRGRFMSVES